MATTTAPKAPQYITMSQAARAYGVTTNCLFGWRNGTATQAPMPIQRVEGTRNVRFKLSELRAWNKKHGRDFAVDPVVIVAQDHAADKAAHQKRTRHSAADVDRHVIVARGDKKVSRSATV